MRLRTLYGWVPDRRPHRPVRTFEPNPAAALLKLVRRAGEVGVEPAAALLKLPVASVAAEADRLAAARLHRQSGHLAGRRHPGEQMTTAAATNGIVTPDRPSGTQGHAGRHPRGDQGRGPLVRLDL